MNNPTQSSIHPDTGALNAKPIYKGGAASENIEAINQELDHLTDKLDRLTEFADRLIPALPQKGVDPTETITTGTMIDKLGTTKNRLIQHNMQFGELLNQLEQF